ncbi:MAG TPA: YfhO family protein [Actinomycetota bacterium]|nr:YfhO family protein [Actinomycetota bacterium]
MPLLLAAVIVADSLLSFGAFYDWAETSPSPASFTAALSASHPIASGWGAIAQEPGGIGRYFFIGATPIPIGQDFVDLTDARRQRSVNANNVLMARDWAIATDMGEDGSVTGTADLWQASSHVFDLLRVTTVLIDPVYAFGGPGPGSLLTGGTPVGHSGLLRYNYTPKLPEAFVVGASHRAGFSREMKAIHGDLAFDPAKVALIDQPCPACPAGPPGQAGSAGAVSWDASTAAVTVRAARPALLVLSQAWSPGWEATVRGRTVPAIRVDGLVQGVPVPAGTTRVVLTYHAPGLRTGFGITVAAVLAFLAAGVAAWWKSRNPAGVPGGR